MTDNEVRMLSLGLLLIVFGLFYLFGILPAAAQYGPNWGIYGPYGRPPPGAYDYPPGYIPPIRRPRPPWIDSPQYDPCIQFGQCGGRRPMPMPQPRWFEEEFEE